MPDQAHTSRPGSCPGGRSVACLYNTSCGGYGGTCCPGAVTNVKIKFTICKTLSSYQGRKDNTAADKGLGRTSHDGLPHAAAVREVVAQLCLEAGRPLVYAMHWAALLRGPAQGVSGPWTLPVSGSRLASLLTDAQSCNLRLGSGGARFAFCCIRPRGLQVCRHDHDNDHKPVTYQAPSHGQASRSQAMCSAASSRSQGAAPGMEGSVHHAGGLLVQVDGLVVVALEAALVARHVCAQRLVPPERRAGRDRYPLLLLQLRRYSINSRMTCMSMCG